MTLYRAVDWQSCDETRQLERAPRDRPNALTAADAMFNTSPNRRRIMVHRRSNQRDRCEHIGVECAYSAFADPLAEVTGGGPPALVTRMFASGNVAGAASRPEKPLRPAYDPRHVIHREAR